MKSEREIRKRAYELETRIGSQTSPVERLSLKLRYQVLLWVLDEEKWDSEQGGPVEWDGESSVYGGGKE